VLRRNVFIEVVIAVNRKVSHQFG